MKITRNYGDFKHEDQIIQQLSLQQGSHFLGTFHHCHHESVPVPLRLVRPERSKAVRLRGCIQNFSDWPPWARTANGTIPCH